MAGSRMAGTDDELTFADMLVADTPRLEREDALHHY
jgi:hypothetical protein